MIVFNVTSKSLVDMLALPVGTEIYSIARHEYIPDVFVFTIERDDLPEVIEGALPLEIPFTS
jgi:hypothetical protein